MLSLVFKNMPNLEVNEILELLFFYLQEMHPDLTVTDMEASDQQATIPVLYFQINNYYNGSHLM
jgi:hypothetical protein